MRVKVFCGIDWAEGHHDVALVDADGALVAKRRIDDSADGFAEPPASPGPSGTPLDRESTAGPGPLMGPDEEREAEYRRSLSHCHRAT